MANFFKVYQRTELCITQVEAADRKDAAKLFEELEEENTVIKEEISTITEILAENELLEQKDNA